MNRLIRTLALLVSLGFISCGGCDIGQESFVGTFVGETECFDMTTNTTTVVITQGSSDTQFFMSINNLQTISGFADNGCEMDIADAIDPANPSAIVRFEILLEGDILSYRESSTSTLNGIELSCTGTLTRQ